MLTVQGDVNFVRADDNVTSKLLRFYILENAEVYITGDFRFDYKNSSWFESDYDVFLQNNAILDVSGETEMITSSGAALTMVLQNKSKVYLRDSVTLQVFGGLESSIISKDSSEVHILASALLYNSGGVDVCKLKAAGIGSKINVTGDVTLKSTNSYYNTKLEATANGSSIYVGQDVIMDAFDENDVSIELTNNSRLYLGGNITRETPYGFIYMESGTELVLIGENAQELPQTKLAGSENDEFKLDNISIENTSGVPILLNGDLIISDTMILKTGIIESTDAAMLIVKPGAQIIGGNSLAYVDGPIKKEGTTNGDSFLFPLGDKGVYAPLGISPVSNDNSEYTARYLGDPPPFGNLVGKVAAVSNDQYWTLDKTAGSEDVQITLNWTNSGGFTKLDSLLVVGLDASENWVSFGNGGTTGSVFSDAQGSVMSMGDPPPFGILNFTIGSTTTESLPVDLTRFVAVAEMDKVYLQWETASELNTDRFIVQHSNDGTQFRDLTEVASLGEGAELRTYHATDLKPYYGSNFYRLKMIDTDGTFEYSSIEVVAFKVLPNVEIYPNPVTEFFTIQGGDLLSDAAQIEVFDQSGKNIYAGQIKFDDGSFQVSTESLNVHMSGSYLIRITIDGEEYVLKFIKLK